MLWLANDDKQLAKFIVTPDAFSMQGYLNVFLNKRPCLWNTIPLASSKDRGEYQNRQYTCWLDMELMEEHLEGDLPGQRHYSLTLQYFEGL